VRPGVQNLAEFICYSGSAWTGAGEGMNIWRHNRGEWAVYFSSLLQLELILIQFYGATRNMVKSLNIDL
jgi:hypothetical protein